MAPIWGLSVPQPCAWELAHRPGASYTTLVAPPVPEEGLVVALYAAATSIPATDRPRREKELTPKQPPILPRASFVGLARVRQIERAGAVARWRLSTVLPIRPLPYPHSRTRSCWRLPEPLAHRFAGLSTALDTFQGLLPAELPIDDDALRLVTAAAHLLRVNAEAVVATSARRGGLYSLDTSTGSLSVATAQSMLDALDLIEMHDPIERDSSVSGDFS